MATAGEAACARKIVANLASRAFRRPAVAADIDQRVGAIQDALASFRSASQELANKLTSATHVGADLTSSVFKTADVLDHEIHGVIGALETAKAEILSGASSTREVIESFEVQ